MSQSEAVSFQQRQATHELAGARMDLAAQAWLNARAGGRVPPAIDAELDTALGDLRRAGRRLREAARRQMGTEPANETILSGAA